MSGLLIKILGLIFLFTLSCTHKKNVSNEHPDGEVGQNLPEWIINPEKECRDQIELCASGEAHSIREADLNAHKAMLGIFETKIEASFKTELRQWDEKSYARTEEQISEEIESSVEGILNGAQIAKRFEKDGIYFSFLKLNRRKASSLIKEEIQKIDESLRNILEMGQKSFYLEALTLDEKRRILGQKLRILYDNIPAPFYSKKDIEKLKYSQDKRHEITIRIEEGESCYIEEHLSQMGFIIVSNQDQGHLLKCWQTEKQGPLKVEGFVRYTFSLKIEAFDKQGNKAGVIRSSFTSNGRNKEQAFQKVKDEITNFAKESIPRLNLN